MIELRRAAEEMLKDLEQRAELEIHAPNYDGDGVPEVACGNGVYYNLRAALNEPDGWISVDDRMPKNGTRVLTYSDYGLYRSAYASDSWGGGFSTDKDRGCCVMASHWMSLPEPPEQP